MQPFWHRPHSSPTPATLTLLVAERCFSSAATLASPSSFPSSLPPASFYSRTHPFHPCSRPLHHHHRLNPLTFPLPLKGLPRVCDAQNAHTRRCSLDAMPSSPKWDLHLTMLLCCVASYPSLFFWLIKALTTSDFHQIRSRGRHIQFVSLSSNAHPRAPIG